MGNILETLDDILSKDSGYTTTYHRKDSEDELDIYKTIQSLDEHQLEMVEKAAKQRRERLQYLRENKQDPRKFPE